MEGRGDRVMAPVSLQDLRRRLYAMAKADTRKRFGDLYGRVAELETLRAGYELAKRNDGAPGSVKAEVRCPENTEVRCPLFTDGRVRSEVMPEPPPPRHRPAWAFGPAAPPSSSRGADSCP